MRHLWVLHFLALVASSTWALKGDHVCQRTEEYNVTFKEVVEIPVETLESNWCLQPPFKCIRTKILTKYETRTKIDLKTRKIDECCEGYAPQEFYGDTDSEARCVPSCKSCVNGYCTAPNVCTCYLGFQGADCYFECPNGSYGKDCMYECNCNSNNVCDPKTGVCFCSPGWVGNRCDIKCSSGFWGDDCRSKCICPNVTNNECHHETGKCSSFESIVKKNWTVGDIFGVSDVSVVSLPFYRETKKPDDHVEDKASGMRPVGGSSNEATTAKFGEARENLEKLGKTLDNVRIDEQILPRVVFSPASEYVKNVKKDEDPIPMDVAALIVIGSMISLSLTSVAALMIFHMRARFIKALRMTVYDESKEPQMRQFSAERQHLPSKEIVPDIGTLSRVSVRAPSIFFRDSEKKTSLSLDDTLSTYANATVTIDIRNLRELLEGHYDHPTSSLKRKDNEEHIYDEIPLSSSPFAPEADLSPQK